MVIAFMPNGLSILIMSSQKMEVEVISMLSIEETMAEKTIKNIKLLRFWEDNPFFTARINSIEKRIFNTPLQKAPFWAVSSFSDDSNFR